MATPTAIAPAVSLATGSIENSVVVVGNNNQVEYNAAGAIVNHVDAAILPTRRHAPIVVLPRQPSDFIGRQDDLASLLAAAGATQTVALWADNGLGKSSLASEALYALNQADATRNVAYLDAQGLHGDDLVRGVYDLFYQRPALYLPTRSQMVPDLQEVRAVVFADNLDVAGNDLSSLVNIAPQCLFILISTKRALSDAQSIRLQGLPDTDALGLFERKYERPLNDPARQAAIEICKLLKGSPDLIIRTAIRGADNDEEPGQLLAELRAAGADEKSLAALTVEPLGANEKKVLAFLAVVGEDPVPLPMLQARFPDFDVAAALEHLKTLQLVRSHSPRYSLCGMLPSTLAAAWDLTASQDDVLQSAISWLSQQAPSEPVIDSLPMMVHVLTDAAERQQWTEVIRLGRILERFVFYYTRWQAWADVLNVLLRAAKATGDRALEGWSLHQLGSGALAQGILDVAGTNLGQALKIREAIKDRPGLQVTRHNLDLLRGVAGPTHGGGGSGGHPFTYGFFGFAGLIAIAIAGYALFRPKPAPPATAIVPPILITTAAPLPATSTPTVTATFTPSETAAPTNTPTVTPTPTATPGPFGGVVIIDRLACRYGPGEPYMYAWTLYSGDHVEVLGSQDTAFGPWVYVKFLPPPGYGAPKLPCWVNPKFLKMEGEIPALPANIYPDKAPLIIWNDPKFVPWKFPPPSHIAVGRNGNIIDVSWIGKNNAPGDRACDRVSPGCPLFLAEFWTCQAGQMVFTPQSIYFEYDKNVLIASVSTEIQDDGCSTLSHGRIYVAHSDGYIGPANVFISP